MHTQAHASAQDTHARTALVKGCCQLVQCPARRNPRNFAKWGDHSL